MGSQVDSPGFDSSADGGSKGTPDRPDPLPVPSISLSDVTALCHGLLLGAATRHTTIARTEPEAPTVQYLTAYSNGWEAGQLASLGLVMSLLTGRSPTEIVDEALTHAAVDAAFPSGLHMPSADHEAA